MAIKCRTKYKTTKTRQKYTYIYICKLLELIHAYILESTPERVFVMNEHAFWFAAHTTRVVEKKTISYKKGLPVLYC